MSLVDRFSVVAFDLDGVLVDSFQCWWELLSATLKSREQPPPPRGEFVSIIWGQDVEADRRRFFPDWTVERVIAHYAAELPKYASLVQVEPDAAATLEALRKQGKRLAVATNSPTPIAAALLDRASLTRFFDWIVGAEQVPRGKPEPDLLRHILGKAATEAGAMAYVGDSDYDARAARAAGVHFIGFRRPGDARIERLAALGDPAV